MMTRYRLFVLTGILTVACTGLSPAATEAVPSMAGLIEAYAADQHDVSAAWDLPGSPLRFDRLEALNRDWQARLQTVAFTALPPASKIDWLLLRNDIDAQRTGLARERQQWNEIAHLVVFRDGIDSLELARLKGGPLDCREAASCVNRMAAQIKELRARLDLGLKTNATATASNSTTIAATTNSPLIVSASHARRAASATDSLRATLKKWYAFRDGYLPEFSWWLKKPYEDTDKALEDYAKFLREEVAKLKGKDDDPIVGQSLGAAALADAIRHEFIAYDAETLLALGERELARCETEMKAAARDMGFGDDWKAALAKVKADYVPPGEQGDLIAGLAREAIGFIKTRNLVTIPPLCEETWSLTMIPPETLKTIPYAAYNGQAMMVAYARDSMAQDDKLMTMRGNNRHFTRTVTPHELIPGHHLQRFQALRNNTQRTRFSTPFLVEGWALYWERRLWDLGWAQTPENRIGMLFWRMTRAARVIVTLKFHLGRMTPGDMADFLVERVGHERLGATAEARRFADDGFSPLYQAGYLHGSLQLEALRRETVGKGLMTEQAFNDAVLAENAIPIELIRASLLNLPLAPDYKPVWRFADTP